MIPCAMHIRGFHRGLIRGTLLCGVALSALAATSTAPPIKSTPVAATSLPPTQGTLAAATPPPSIQGTLIATTRQGVAAVPDSTAQAAALSTVKTLLKKEYAAAARGGVERRA